ncbi:MAG: hypothetical protein JWL84_5916 [Rhodospirillales bacterium]|jgi:hypothetical protein|nr:hypothetical protein [Rhodospirillales bacterium]
MMDWLQGEPKLDEVLADPIVQAILIRDHVDADGLRRFLTGVQRRRSERARYEAWVSLVAMRAA